MTERRFTDPSQPQTLQGAVIFSYISAVLAFLYFLARAPGPWLILILLGVTAFFIANERRWAYYAGAGLAIVYLLVEVAALFTFNRSLFGLLGVFFAGVLLALLLHPQSRAYQKIWFH